MLTIIRLHGELGQKFGRRHVLDISTPAEAIRGIEANRPGLKAYLASAGDRGVDFRVQVGKADLENPVLVNFAARGRDIRISPVVRGAKDKWVPIVAGIALVALTWGAGAGYLGVAAKGLVGANVMGISGLTYGAMVGGIGFSLAASGIAQALAPTPKFDAGTNGSKSDLFGGPVNATVQGLPVPLVYGGPIVVGSIRISAGIKSEDKSGATAAKTGITGTEGEGPFTDDPDYPTYTAPASTSNVKGRNLESIQVARLLDLICEGEIAGLCDAAGTLLAYENRNKGIFFDRTVIQNADGTFNYKDAATAIKYGTNAQDYLPGFPETESTTVVNAEVIKGSDKVGNAITRTIPAGAYDAVRIDVQIPALWKIDSKGNQIGAAVHFGIHLYESGTWKECVGSNVLDNGELDGLIQGTATEPYVRSYRIPLQGAGPWDIRILKESTDAADTTKEQSRIFWTSYTTIIDQKLRYPNSVIAGSEISAAVNNSIPETAFRVKGLKVKIPDNYDPATRNYTGAWSGTFATSKAWTNNPAWIFYDLITNERYGLGKYIPEAQVDKWALYTIARYCDGVDLSGNFVGVDDGNGGTEPRFAVNVAINSLTEAWKLVQDLASAFRGMVYWSAGMVSAVQDSPNSPAFVFTNASAVDGVFNYSGSALKARHTVALVTWRNPADPFSTSGETEYVSDDTGIARYGIREVQIGAFGCTSRGQAQRLGKWLLYTERLETETVNFLAGMEGARCRPGDLIGIRDRYRTTNRMGGRVLSVGVGTVTLDAAITISGSGDTLTIAQTDGSLVEYPITTGASTVATVALTGSLASVVAGAVFVHANTAAALQEFRVLNVREKDKNQFEIMAVEFVSTKFAAVESGVDTTPGQTSDLPAAGAVPAAPASATLTKNRVITGPKAELVLDLNWPASTSKWVTGYRVEFRIPGGAWEVLRDREPGLSVRAIPYSAAGDYSARVFAVSVDGTLSVPAVTTLTVALDTTPPGVVTGLAAANVVGGIFISWTNPTDADFLLGGKVEIYEHTASTPAPSAGTAATYDAGLAEGFTRSGLTAATTRYYWVRTVDADGNASAWAGSVNGTAQAGPAGATGATGATGAAGATGATGAVGPGVVSMGDYSAAQVYYQTSTRRDVVKYGGNFYITNNAGKSGTSTWGTPGGGDWDGPYSSYKFVATAILLAEDATITKTLVMGDGATGNGGIIRSVGATAYGTGAGFWMNPRNGSNLTEFRIGDPAGQYMAWDGSTLTIRSPRISGDGLYLSSTVGMRFVNDTSVMTITGGSNNGAGYGAQIDLCGTGQATGGALVLAAGNNLSNPIGSIRFRTGNAERGTVDYDGRLIWNHDLYTTAAGATRVGFLNASGAGTSQTYVGLRYDSGNSRGELAALTGGVAWRDVLIAPNATALVDALQIAGYDVSFGANDSAGTGFRQLRVANS
jgi:predicted phage tail protein